MNANGVQAFFVEGLSAADLPDHLRPYSEADLRRELRRREEDRPRSS